MLVQLIASTYLCKIARELSLDRHQHPLVCSFNPLPHHTLHVVLGILAAIFRE